MKLIFNIQGGDFANAGTASSQVKRNLVQLNLDPGFIRKTVVALYEAEVNVVAHAYSGVMEITIDHERIQLVLTDKGPGIPDIEKAMEKGYSTATEAVREMGFGAGMGLPNIRKNTDFMHIESTINQGTTLTIINRI